MRTWVYLSVILVLILAIYIPIFRWFILGCLILAIVIGIIEFLRSNKEG